MVTDNGNNKEEEEGAHVTKKVDKAVFTQFVE
jgi:hypothetical protein